MSQQISGWSEQLMLQIKAQPGKAAVLGLLAPVMAILWIKTMGGGGAMPSAASAAVPAALALPVPEVRKASPRASRAEAALRDFLSKPSAGVPRNLFAVRLEQFPLDQTQPAAAPTSVGDGFWDQLAKSMAGKADQEKARRILVDNLRARASQLELQSIVMRNGSPKALVNGTLLGEGDVVNGFRVVKIEAKRIVVEREGVRLEVLFGFSK